ncbi:MAG: cytochrome c biogenesis protein CcsA [Cyclobacteriaceae bacterium]|nr:cytochrome c biogenesis protein CcsA [Cyclobacteriaceae bacterium]
MKYFRFLFSGSFMGMLLVIFAISIGYATFLENDFDSTTAKMLIYNARWFEVLMLLMVVNFAGMIFTRQLYRKSKLNILVIHVALVVIIIGAAITRYVGFEGQMHIRQGETSNRYTSLDHYMNVHIENGGVQSDISKRIWLSPVNSSLFHENMNFNNSEYTISLDRYLPNATEALVPDANGSALLSLATAGPNGREDFILHDGQTAMANGSSISFGTGDTSGDIQFTIVNGQLKVKSTLFAMIADTLHATGFAPVKAGEVMQLPNMNMMVKDFAEKAVFSYLPTQEAGQATAQVARATVEKNGEKTERYIKMGAWEQIDMDGDLVSLRFGNQNWVLPFSLRLNEFQLERYPGSMSPSSFASEITLIDKENNVERPFRIFMNNILAYQGYRFYQSSYDQDEKGTILSVNHDFWGTAVTYFGYALLFGSLIVSFFTKKTRFTRVSEQIKETHEQRKKLVTTAMVLLLTSVAAFPVLAKDANEISKAHAAAFGKLLIQNKDGRIIPVNTTSNQTLMKMYKKSSFEGLTPDQVFLGMISNAEHWKNQPIIKVSDPDLQKTLGISGNYASINQFFDQNGQYILKQQIDAAYAKKPAMRNMFDKELIYVDERVNVAYMIFNGSIFKILPNANEPNGHWESPLDLHQHATAESVTTGTRLFMDYLGALYKAIPSGNYSEADAALQALKAFQITNGGSIIPSQTKINVEVFYNNTNIFKNLFPVFMMAGIVLFGFFFIQIFKPALQFRLVLNIFVGILLLCFAAQTVGLGLRWYIAGHAPWSNGYESMIYIAWATMLAGFIFMRKAPIILSVTSLLTGVTLLTAHMSWMNPEITNLVPVLKSYWLTIHVATITASYGFLALGGLTAFLNLMIMIFRNKDNALRVNLTLKELSLIIELSFTIGLILLVIGNFLGGVWANESWGRYWGWDPKETWSLVTIIVYSFILHMRLIPGFRSTFSFNLLSMFAFSSVLMTYFGVNYYLSGLHSYASGDPVPVPSFVYYTVAIMV